MTRAVRLALIGAVAFVVGTPLAYAFADPASPIIIQQLLQQFEETVRQTKVLRQAMEAAQRTATLAQDSIDAAKLAKRYAEHPDALLQGIRDEAASFAREHGQEAAEVLRKRTMAAGLVALDEALSDPSVSEWQQRMHDTLARAEGGLQSALGVSVDTLHRFDPHRAANDLFADMQLKAKHAFDQWQVQSTAGRNNPAVNTLFAAQAAIRSSEANAATANLLTAISARVDAHLSNGQVAMSRALEVQRHVYDQLKQADVDWRARPLFSRKGQVER